MPHVLYTVEEQFRQDKNYALLYGRSNRTSSGEYLNYGKSGNVIQSGAGIRELCSYANQYYYNEFSLKLIEDALYSLSVGVLGFADRTFVLETGELGAALFSKAVSDRVSGWNAVGYYGGSANNPAVIQKVSSELHSNALAAGFQFVEWRAPMGVTLKLQINPFYDDTVNHLAA
jgi:hypothetical protein